MKSEEFKDFLTIQDQVNLDLSDITVLEKNWDTIYRWDWFNVDAWRPTFRAPKSGGSSGAVAAILGDPAGKLVLDCTCGFGLKTIVLKGLGVDVSGSDSCVFAVEKARELARLEGRKIEYFHSRWTDLPSNTDKKFDIVFNDALSWTVTRQEFEKSLAAFREVLSPGGLVVFMGAPEGSPSDAESRRAFFEETWKSLPKSKFRWTHVEGDIKCTHIEVFEKHDMYIDAKHYYMIDEAGKARLEIGTVRQPLYWDWATLAEMFATAGFAKLETRAIDVPGRTTGPLKINIAIR